MDDLDYEKHLDGYKALFGYCIDSPDIDQRQILKSAEEKAKHHHAICLSDPLFELVIAITSASQKLKDKNAKYYLLYGAARRMHLIFGAYREIRSIAYEERTQPLTQDNELALSQAVNNIYIHLLGILDNFAWSLLCERQAELASSLPRNDIGLFSKKFRKKCAAYSEISDEITIHDAWHEEVKTRRDPVAHRIPLYVPPAAVTPDQVEQYSASYSNLSDNLKNLRLHDAEQALGRMDFIGHFLPYFVHHPDDPPIPIYPTIPTDLSHLVRIWRTVAKSLLRREAEMDRHTPLS